MFKEYTSPMFLSPLLVHDLHQWFLFCCHQIGFPSDVHSLVSPTVFILFIAVSVFRVMSTVLHTPTVYLGLSPFLFSEWHIVPLLYIQIKQSRVYSRKALDEWKASRRLGKQIRGLYRFLSKSPRKSKPPIPKIQPFHFSFALMIYTNVPYFSFTLFFLIALPMALLVF